MGSKIFLINCFIIVFFNHCNQTKKLSEVLTNGCFWDILDKGSPHPINSCYKFNSDGSLGFYYYNYFNKKRTDSVTLYNEHDLIYADTWKIINDSLKIRNNKYKVNSFSVDSIFLSATSSDTMILIRNCKARYFEIK